MAWPEPTDYNEAIQSPQVCFSDDELRHAQPVLSPLGLPMPCAGNFALVYQMNGAANQSWAVKCFTREAPARRQRYQAISEHLNRAALPFTVDFRYLEQGIRIGGQWYPAVKMRWVEGLTLNALLREHVDRPQVLQRLAQMWLPLAQKLRTAGIAHADLQHGNVLLVPGQKAATLDLRLIDYDGMFVPALAEVPSGEVGHPGYQHPQRLRDGTCNAEIDRFAHLVIYTVLRCLLVGGRSLWERHDNNENLLFREQDFKEPASSKLFEELWRLGDADARALVGHLLLASVSPLERVPLLEELVDDGQVMPLTPRAEKRVRELLPGAVQAGPVPVEVAPPAAPSQPKENADREKVIPLVPLAVEAPAPRRATQKRPQPARTTDVETTPTRPRWLLAGAFAGGGAAILLLVVILIVALLNSGETPPAGPGEGPRPGPGPQPPQPVARSLKLDPIAAVNLTAGQRVEIPIRLRVQGEDAPIEVRVEGLPERVREEQALLLNPGQTDALITLRAELGAAEEMRQIRVVAQGRELEDAQPVQLTIAKQTAVRLPPLPAIRLKPGDLYSVPLRLISTGHDVPLNLMIEGLPDTVRQVDKPVSLPPQQLEAGFALTVLRDAPPGNYQVRVYVLAGGARIAEESLDVRVEPAGSLILGPIGAVTLKAGESQAVNVNVQRQGCVGEIQLEAAPAAGVRVLPATVPPFANGALVIVAADKNALGPVNLTLVARLGPLQATQPLQVIVQGQPVVVKPARPVGREVRIPTVDGVDLRGTFYAGQRGQKSPCVMFLHAFGEDGARPGWVPLIAELQQAGFAVLRFDFRGHGDSTRVNAAFWKQSANVSGIRGGKAGKVQIVAKDFASNYRCVLANDIAAARAFLDERSFMGECDSTNMILIGEKDAATLGALWLNSECYRYRVTSKTIKFGVQP
ncbi:MAG TPA: hypothetical protein VEL76_19145, partial [Gemmataceae bacterium]|nr:hypothetical protein [Gemmataceae bacterium]